MTEEERLALRTKARNPANRCTQCGHMRIQHSPDKERDDFMCLICPPHHCHYDPFTTDEWRRIFGYG